jgi:hypothetical protein
LNAEQQNEIPLPAGIIDRISELIGDKRLPKDQRAPSLKAAANEAWTMLFPEDALSNSPGLSPEVRMQRWRRVRDQLAGNPDPDKIIRVLESPANGEGFDWLN